MEPDRRRQEILTIAHHRRAYKLVVALQRCGGIVAGARPHS